MLGAVVKALPEYDYIYYGDTKNLPYGDREEEEILRLTKHALEELFKKGCAVVIVACNTASAETLRTLQENFIRQCYPDRKVLGVIIPTVESLVELNPPRALLLATQRTIRSNKYPKELSKISHQITLHSLEARELVPLIESGKTNDAAQKAFEIIETEREGEWNVVILGCTHFSILKEELRKRLPEVTFLSQDEIIPEKLKEYFENHPEIEVVISKGKERTVFLTEYKKEYESVITSFLGKNYTLN